MATPTRGGIQGATFVVAGLSEINRSLASSSPAVRRELHDALKELVEPMRRDASTLARNRLSGMRRSRLAWWEMRTGTTRLAIYVAPVQRGVRGRGQRSRRRPNLVELMMGRSLEPALVRNEQRIAAGMQSALDAFAATLSEEL